MEFEAFDARDFGRGVRELRRQKGWTQAQLAEWLGVHRITVVRLERGLPVALPVAMHAISLLGAKAVLVRKQALVGERSEGPALPTATRGPAPWLATPRPAAFSPEVDADADA